MLWYFDMKCLITKWNICNVFRNYMTLWNEVTFPESQVLRDEFFFPCKIGCWVFRHASTAAHCNTLPHTATCDSLVSTNKFFFVFLQTHASLWQIYTSLLQNMRFFCKFTRFFCKICVSLANTSISFVHTSSTQHPSAWKIDLYVQTSRLCKYMRFCGKCMRLFYTHLVNATTHHSGENASGLPPFPAPTSPSRSSRGTSRSSRCKARLTGNSQKSAP